MHSGLCACYHNVEDGQKGKQDAYSIFWKFPKGESNALFYKKQFRDLTHVKRKDQVRHSTKNDKSKKHFDIYTRGKMMGTHLAKGRGRKNFRKKAHGFGSGSESRKLAYLFEVESQKLK